MKMIALVISIYIGMAFVTYCAMMADSDYEYPDHTGKRLAEDRTFAIVFALVPPCWISAIVVTGGYYALRHPRQK